MHSGDFVKEYKNLVERAVIMSEKARREGLLALEKMIDEDKYIKRDIFEYGIRLTVDGTDAEFINRLLTNVIEQETDKEKKLYKTLQKEAVLAIQGGWNTRMLVLLLNSYVNIDVEESMKQYNEM
jgi:flagellar motor component MotA